MNNFRTIEQVIPPPSPHMVGDGFRVRGWFGIWLAGASYWHTFSLFYDLGLKDSHGRGIKQQLLLLFDLCDLLEGFVNT